MTKTVDSTSDQRTANNAVRHTYRVLSDDEKAKMQAVKDKGKEFLDLLDSLRTPIETTQPMGMNGSALVIKSFDREMNIAAQRVEEAIMWAVKGITA